MSEETSHVVIVSQHYPPDQSGNASRISDTSTNLCQEGWEVTVLAPPPAFPHGEFSRTWRRQTTSERDGVTIHRLWAWQPTATDPSFLSRMAYYLLFPLHALMWLMFYYREYDAVITSSPPIFTGLAGLPLGLLTADPWVVDVRDLWIDAAVGLGFITDGGLIERASRWYQGLVLRTADRITVTTSVLGERLIEQYGVNEVVIRHVPNGVETDKFRPVDADPDPNIVYTGNVGHAQDLEACVRAMASVETDSATLKIVGDGDIIERLNQLAVEESVEDRVEFTGLVSRETIPDVLNNAMIGVAPLKSDPTLEYAVPTKAYEYASCELPIVATGVGEIESLIAESGGGIHTDNNPEKLAETFDSLLRDGERRETLGTKGREHIVEQYDRTVVAREVGEILKAVTDQ